MFQGCDEFGDHAGGPSEKDHEQHTDYESSDATSPRHRCPGVTGTGHLGQAVKTKTELIWSSAWDVTGIIVKVNRHLLCLTLPAVSGVESFLCSSVKDCGPDLQRALKRGKGQKKQQQKKKLTGQDFLFFCFSFFKRRLQTRPHIKWHIGKEFDTNVS